MRLIKWAGLTLVVAVAVAALALAAYSRVPDGIVPDGVHVAGMDWSSKSTVIARAELEGWRRARLQEPLALVAPSHLRTRRRWSPTRALLGADVDVAATLRAAEAARRGDGPLARMLGWVRRADPVQVSPVWTLDQNRLRRYLKRRVAPRIAQPSRDARLLPARGGFQVVPDRPGSALDVAGAVRAVQERLPASSADPIMLPVRTVRPRVTAADLRGIEGEVAHFRTSYGERGNRARNIAVACRHINGTVLKPGDVFSYNEVVGPRDEDSGFKMAPVIVRGRLQPGLGGGVCQVSSTLYNAVLRADLEIVSRTHHAFPVHYLPAGQDATVAYGSIDFRFRNNTDGPVAIAASGTGGEVSMRIYGKRAPGREVRIRRTNVRSWASGVEVVHDSGMPAGRQETVERGHAGWQVTVWRDVLVDGQRVKHEVVSNDRYRAFPRIVAVGTRRPARPPESAPQPSSAPPPAADAPEGGSLP